jgi:hypothetical protein
MGRSGLEARLFLVLRLYDSKEALKMATKLDWEVDVEGAVGGVVMMDRREASISRRPCLRPVPRVNRSTNAFPINLTGCSPNQNSCPCFHIRSTTST